MSLLINAPTVERRLEQEAHRHGVAPADYAIQILSAHLEPLNGTQDKPVQPFHTTATPEEWERAFDEWLDGHTPRQPMPERAFDRESFYEGRP